MDKIVIGDFTR